MSGSENIALIENIAKKIVYFIIFGIITVYILIQLISISNFSFNYYKLEKYGEGLKTRCKNNNIEFETSRYQIYNNILNYLLNNDKDNKINYIIILFIFLTFVIIFTIISTFILYIIINEIKTINSNNSIEFNFLCNILIVFTCLISICYFPFYIGKHLDNNNKWDINEFENIMNYILYGFIILCIIIFIIRLNVYNYYKNYSYGNIFFITLIVLYFGIAFYTKLMIKFYKNNIVKIDYKSKNIKNIEDKKKEILKKYNNDDIFDEKKNIISEYIIEIFGFKYYTDIILDNDLNNINLYIYIIQIILIVFGVIFLINRLKGLNKLYSDPDFTFKNFLDCIFYKIKYCDNILYHNSEIKILYNFLFIPLCMILVIFIIINSTINFNNNLNENIIIKPLIIYKRELSTINDNFKNLIHNDKLDYTYVKSVDKNTANAILLVLYNDLFSDFLSIDNYEDENDKKKQQEIINELNMTPEFHFTFSDEKESIINYNDLNEYDINYYLNNKNKHNDIFKLNEYSKNVNKQCNTINTYLIYYIIRKIFLYNPIAEEIENSNGDADNLEYTYYTKILKYKILKAINNIIKKKNYLGNSKLDVNNNHNVNNNISIKNHDPELTIDEIRNLYRVNLDDVPGGDVESQKVDFADQVKNIDENNVGELLSLLRNGYFNKLITIEILSSIYDTRISNLLIDDVKLMGKIDDIIHDYILFIKRTQQSYYLNTCADSETGCKITNEQLIRYVNNNENSENLFRFIYTYKNNIKETFSEINIKLKEFNYDNDDSASDNKNENKLKLNRYIIDNYNSLNKDDNYLNKKIILVKQDCSSVIDDGSHNQVNSATTSEYQLLRIIINDIILSFYFNNYIILKVYNLYSELYLDALTTNIQALYISNDKKEENKNLNDIKIEYTTILSKLNLILDKTLNNNKLTELVIYEDDNLIDLSLNDKIIENMIEFDKINNNDELYLNIVLNKIKTFEKNAINFDSVVSKEIIKDVMGINNKIEFYLKFIESRSSNVDDPSFIIFNDKTKELINNLLILQNEIFNNLKNSDLSNFNYNKLLKTLDYEYKFNKYIVEYKEYYNNIYNNNADSTILAEDANSDRSFNINMKNSKVTKRDAEKTSLTSTILLLVYIVSYICIASIK